jgi:uncharacterized protein (UPF0332 family)
MRAERDISDLLRKAKESIKSARILLKEEQFDFSAGRSYYAMFYATEALLLTKSIAVSKHSALISLFGKEFVKSGLMPSKLRDYIVEAFDIRQVGDYGPVGSVSKEKSAALVTHAQEFVDSVEEYLKKGKRLG